jgi:uncharacterized YigZ family protein
MKLNSDQYKTIQKTSEGFFKEKGSKFYAFAFHVETEEEIAEIRIKIKKEYHDARHHVYAYRLGADMKTARASDDGEPSNSSGPPILGKIRSFELTDILIITVRYFGGRKLGIPGLINAYGTAAENALLNADIIIKTVTKKLTINYEYPQMNFVMKVVKDNNLIISKQDFQLSCKIVLDIPESKYNKLKEVFTENHKLDVL